MYQIKLTNDSESLAIEKSNKDENFKISNTDGQTIWLSEEELRELKYLITDILQHLNKNDYE